MPAQLFGLISYLLVFVVILPFAAINLLIVKTDLLPNIKSFIISTGSMDPSIPRGSIIYTLTQKNYKVGDVIAYRDSIGRVTHRIKDTVFIGDTKYFITKGDANKINDDQLIPEENIYGKTVAAIPYFGEGILILKNF